VDFHYKNILPIPNFLTKSFIQLPSRTPYFVEKAFLDKVDEPLTENLVVDLPDFGDKDADSQSKEKEAFITNTSLDKDSNTSKEKDSPSVDITPKDILHIVQFCHLCALGKIPPVLYSSSPDPEITSLFNNSLPLVRERSESSHKCLVQHSADDNDDDSIISSPNNKISKKDHYLINMMIQLLDTMDKFSKTKEEKEPGFKHLESHRKKLILNASVVPPFLTKAPSPTKFYLAFLSKKSQFKAKDMLLHRFQSDQIAFNPNSTFITNM
jgi:hypothetical protein